MCGITGIYSSSPTSPDIIERMLDVIAHRGPDGRSSFQHNDVILGHRRLSIIDLSTGDQPMFNYDKTKAIIYNGEVYNYREIREDLLAKGCRFNTSSDTEVILAAYDVYGPESVNLLNGIFGFCIYDLEKEQLFIARDHFGIKPIHYYYQDGLFLFASEQKAILQHPKVSAALNFKTLHHHFNLRYSPGNDTLFSDIKRLPPGHYLTFDKLSALQIKKYWQLEPGEPLGGSQSSIVEQLQDHLKEAVRRQLVSDVPIGVYLSGGLDSSTIVQKMHELGVEKINTYTLGFNEPTDEFSDARKIAEHFQTNHHEHNLPAAALKDYRKVVWHAEEPKINLIQGFKMSEYVSQHVKVILGGLGGDELLAGYDIHKFIFPFNKWHDRIPSWMQKVFRWKANFIYSIQNNTRSFSLDEYRRGVQMLLAVGDIERFYLILRNTWDYDNPAFKNIYSKTFLNYLRSQNVPPVVTEFQKYFDHVKDRSPLDQVLFTEFHTKMVNDYLLVEDRMSMANSVEERVPFLDRDLVNFGFRIPIELKIRNNQTKFLFRRAMENVLPPRIISKPKWGFTFNPYLQFKKDLKSEFEDKVTQDYIENQGIFNYKYIRQILDHNPHQRMRWHYNYLWLLLGLHHLEDLYKMNTRFS